jgi:hypothetical protein
VAAYALGLPVQVKSIPARTMSVPAVIFCKWLIARMAKSLLLPDEDVSSTNCLKIERHFFEFSTFNLLIFILLFSPFHRDQIRFAHPGKVQRPFDLDVVK